MTSLKTKNLFRIMTHLLCKMSRRNKAATIKDKSSSRRSLEGSTFVLKNISAVQTVLSAYATSTRKSGKKFLDLEENTKDTIPQTLLSQEEVNEIADIPVADLLHEKSRRAYYFLDAKKAQNKFWVTMIDVTLNGPLPNSTQKPCWWCRHKFSSRPVGCPLRYHPQKNSGVEKERFEEKLKSAGLPVSSNDFFETEGFFCSFPCCKAFILDQKGSVKYKESLTLLSLLFSILYSTDKRPVGIFSLDRTKNAPPTQEKHDFPTAPTWKLLKDYGGHLTIEEWRSTFGKLEYDATVNTRRPYMFCSSQYISEKKIKLFKNIGD